MKEKLFDILHRIVPDADISAVNEETSLTADLGLNSMSIMLLAMETEDAFGFEFDDFEDIRTVGDVFRYVEAHATR